MRPGIETSTLVSEIFRAIEGNPLKNYVLQNTNFSI